ncbi:MAG: hypothetical protein AAFQ14_13955 [Cyanobacteria bacterium J06621_12]
MKYRCLLLIAVLWFSFIPIANASNASMCRQRFGQEICILKLKRSAKNYWEYRAKVSADGEKQRDVEIYNCRDRTLSRKGKYPIPFRDNSPGELVCKTFQKQTNTYRPGRW